MCTAYELGNRGGSFPSRVKAKAAKVLLDLDVTLRIVGQNLGGLVVRGDGEIVEMTWGFRRKIQGITKLVWKSIVNSRTDKLDGRMWKKAYEERRCITPMITTEPFLLATGRLQISEGDQPTVFVTGLVPLRGCDPAQAARSHDFH